jgi:hypothetical protein
MHKIIKKLKFKKYNWFIEIIMSSLFDRKMGELLDEKFKKQSQSNQVSGSNYNSNVYYNASASGQYHNIGYSTIHVNNIPTWFSLKHCST